MDLEAEEELAGVSRELKDYVKDGNLELTKALIEKNKNRLDINKKYPDNTTILSVAAEENRFDIVKLLLFEIQSQIKDINCLSSDNKTVLMHAVIHDNFDSVVYMLTLGANVNLRDDVSVVQ